MECKNLRPYTPVFDNPYPDTPGAAITDFVYATPLHLCRCIEAVELRDREDADYIVAMPYTVRFKLDNDDREITVPEGMVTDLASVPRPARIVIGRVGPHLEASILHDFLYIAWQDLESRGANDADREFADKLMAVAMEAADVGAIQRWAIYAAVRTFGGGAYRREDPNRYFRDGSGENA